MSDATSLARLVEDEGSPMPMRNLAPMENALCGAIAGVACRFVIAPFDVVKIRFQVSRRPSSDHVPVQI
jgi:hypothetical protein